MVAQSKMINKTCAFLLIGTAVAENDCTTGDCDLLTCAKSVPAFKKFEEVEIKKVEKTDKDTLTAGQVEELKKQVETLKAIELPEDIMKTITETLDKMTTETTVKAANEQIEDMKKAIADKKTKCEDLKARQEKAEKEKKEQEEIDEYLRSTLKTKTEAERKAKEEKAKASELFNTVQQQSQEQRNQREQELKVAEYFETYALERIMKDLDKNVGLKDVEEKIKKVREAFQQKNKGLQENIKKYYDQIYFDVEELEEQLKKKPYDVYTSTKHDSIDKLQVLIQKQQQEIKTATTSWTKLELTDEQQKYLKDGKKTMEKMIGELEHAKTQKIVSPEEFKVLKKKIHLHFSEKTNEYRKEIKKLENTFYFVQNKDAVAEYVKIVQGNVEVAKYEKQETDKGKWFDYVVSLDEKIEEAQNTIESQTLTADECKGYGLDNQIKDKTEQDIIALLEKQATDAYRTALTTKVEEALTNFLKASEKTLSEQKTKCSNFVNESTKQQCEKDIDLDEAAIKQVSEKLNKFYAAAKKCDEQYNSLAPEEKPKKVSECVQRAHTAHF